MPTAEQQALLIALEIVAPVLGAKRYLCDVRQQTGFDRKCFDRVALSCHRDGLALLSRADLPLGLAGSQARACAVAKEAESEIRIMTECYHYVEPSYEETAGE